MVFQGVCGWEPNKLACGYNAVMSTRSAGPQSLRNRQCCSSGAYKSQGFTHSAS